MFNHKLSKKAVDLVRAQHGGLSLYLQVKKTHCKCVIPGDGWTLGTL